VGAALYAAQPTTQPWKIIGKWWSWSGSTTPAHGGRRRAMRNYNAFFLTWVRRCMPHNRRHNLGKSLGSGGAGRDRTDDLKTASLALSQLSYSPENFAGKIFVPSPPGRGTLILVSITVCAKNDRENTIA
jgi:hypothetical protein